MGKFDRNLNLDFENELISEVYEDSVDMLYKIKQYMLDDKVISLPKDTFIKFFDEYTAKIKENMLFSAKLYVNKLLKDEYKKGYDKAKIKYNKKS